MVHRMLYEYLSPYWERRFLPGSYACRIGKGPLKAVQDLETYFRAHHRHAHAHTKPLFALKADVSRFFPSISHQVLQRQIFNQIENPFIGSLVRKVIQHRATDPGQFILRSPPHMWQLIEPQKSLFKTPRGQGLPIGNLTSQFFANVYMHDCDVWLAKQCKSQRDHDGRRVFLFWQRYVDDILVVGTDPKALLSLLQSLDAFLKSQLQLQLNPKKSSLRPVSQGVDHLGYFVKPGFTTVRHSVRMRTRLQLSRAGVEETLRLAQLQSALSYARHGRNYGLRKSYAALSSKQGDVSHGASQA